MDYTSLIMYLCLESQRADVQEKYDDAFITGLLVIELGVSVNGIQMPLLLGYYTWHRTAFFRLGGVATDVITSA